MLLSLDGNLNHYPQCCRCDLFLPLSFSTGADMCATSIFYYQSNILCREFCSIHILADFFPPSKLFYNISGNVSNKDVFCIYM